MDDLVTWLRAQIAEDYRIAQAASPSPWRANAEHDEVVAVDDITVCDGFALSNNQLRATVDHIVRHDPRNALAQCEAHQRILDMYERHAGFWDTAEPDVKDRDYRLMNAEMDVCCSALRAIGTAYQHRPGYREEWRPDTPCR